MDISTEEITVKEIEELKEVLSSILSISTDLEKVGDTLGIIDLSVKSENIKYFTRDLLTLLSEITVEDTLLVPLVDHLVNKVSGLLYTLSDIGAKVKDKELASLKQQLLELKHTLAQ